MFKKLYLLIIVSTLLFNYSCHMRKFAKGVVEDVKRKDTTNIPTVFSIDSIKNSLDTTKLSNDKEDSPKHPGQPIKVSYSE